MEKINFNYCLENIPAPTKISYQLMLMEKIRSIIKQMQWKPNIYLKKDTKTIVLRLGSTHRNTKNYKALKNTY